MFTPLLASGVDSDFPLLTSLIAVPLVGAMLVAMLPKGRPELAKVLGLAVSFITAGLCANLLWTFKVGEASFQQVENVAWIKDLGISWHLGVDGLSLFLVVLTGLLFPIAILGPDERHNVRGYVAWLLLLEAGVMGVFMSIDLFLFFVMFEVVLVPMYFLIGQWGHGARTYAALKFFVYTMAGSALLLVATVALVALHHRQTGQLTFSLPELVGTELSKNAGRWLFGAFTVAFAIKVPLFPLHTWLPDAHTNAPTAGSVILAGVLLKMGTYRFLRFSIYLFPEAAAWAAPTLLTLGTIGVLYGAFTAIAQKDLKRLVAYSSVAHLGFVVIGTFAFTTQAMSGAVLQAINHGLSTGALFLLVGWVYERRHTREISELKGLQKAAPVLAGIFTIVMLSSIGVPGLNGFTGEFLILVGTFLTRPTFAVIAAVGVILAALYMLWAYQRTFHGEPDEANRTMTDLNLREIVSIAPLLFFIVLLGVYPRPALERIEPSVKALIAHLEFHTADQPKPVVEPDVAKRGRDGVDPARIRQQGEQP